MFTEGKLAVLRIFQEIHHCTAFMTAYVLIYVFFNITGQQIVSGTQQIMRELHVYEFLDMAAVYLVKHPILALFLFSVALCCGIPVLMFVLFAVLTVILTFAGFIVIEG
jgi:hypothetical protein